MANGVINRNCVYTRKALTKEFGIGTHLINEMVASGIVRPRKMGGKSYVYLGDEIVDWVYQLDSVKQKRNPRRSPSTEMTKTDAGWVSDANPTSSGEAASDTADPEGDAGHGGMYTGS